MSPFCRSVLQAIELSPAAQLPREVAAAARATEWQQPRSRGALTTNVIRACAVQLAEYVIFVEDERGQRTLARDPNRYPLFREVLEE